jgi:hypothetical protein
MELKVQSFQPFFFMELGWMLLAGGDKQGG